MTGRFRNLRPFWSDVLRHLRGPQARIADDAIEQAERAMALGELAAARLARLEAENARLRDALAAERNHSAHLAANLAESVLDLLELRATIRRLEGELTTAREQAAVHGAVALTLRARLAASPEQDKRNCLALSDRLIEAYKAVHRLEIELGTAQGRDMAPDWHPASQAIVGGLSWPR